MFLIKPPFRFIKLNLWALSFVIRWQYRHYVHYRAAAKYQRFKFRIYRMTHIFR